MNTTQIIRTGLLAVLAFAMAGCGLLQETRRSPDAPRTSADISAQGAIQPARVGGVVATPQGSIDALRDYDRAARGADDARAEQLARECRPHADRVAAVADDAEAMYYSAVCVALSARAERDGDLLDEAVERAQRARSLNPMVADGGPDRFLGGVYLKAPPWPASIGDLELALEHLERAVTISPDNPENHLLLSEALSEDDRPEAAERALRTAESLIRLAGDPADRDLLRTRIDRVRADL
ncbi:MAG: tetratricopeptide repeat protein [Planctomycetota bacterium]